MLHLSQIAVRAHGPARGRAVPARLLGIAAGLLAAGSIASAQVIEQRQAPAAGNVSVDPRWTPFVGCWNQNTRDDAISLSGRQTSVNAICVSPAGRSGSANATSSAVLTTIVKGRVALRERLDASGVAVAKTVDGCAGTQTGTWSADGHRLYLKAEFRCNDNAVRKESGLLAISGQGDWVSIAGIDVLGSTGVRATRMHDLGVDGATLRFVSDVAAVGDSVTLAGGTPVGYAASTLRTAAGSAVSPDDVLDVSKHVDAAVAEAWLAESTQEFKVDARTLVRLADAGMSPRMIDMLVALSYPKTFAVGRNGSPNGVSGNSAGAGSRGFNQGYGYGALTGANLTGWGLNSCAAAYDGFMARDIYGRSYTRNGCNFGYNSLYNRLYGYNAYGYGTNYYYGSNPVVIVPRESAEPPRGRAVAGRGYTRGDSDPRTDVFGGSAGRSSGASGTGASSGASSGGSSSGGSSSGSSGGTSSGGRTAKAKGGR